MAESCFGCKFLFSRRYGDGSTTYFCTKNPGVVVGDYCTCCGDYKEPTPINNRCKKVI